MRFVRTDDAVNGGTMTRSKTDFMLLAREKESVIQALVDEVLAYDLECHRAHCLNPVDAATQDLGDDHTSVAQMVSQLRANGYTMVTNGVSYGLRQLGKFHLLENRLPEGAGLSRQFSLAAAGDSLVASILAPTAVEAGSCMGSGQPYVSLPCCIGPCVGGSCVA